MPSQIPPPPPSRIPPPPPSRIPPPPPRMPSQIPPSPSRIPPPPPRMPSQIPPPPSRIPPPPSRMPSQIPPPPSRIPPPPPPRFPPPPPRMPSQIQPPPPRIPLSPPPRPRPRRVDKRPPYLLRAVFYYCIYVLVSSLVFVCFSTSFQLNGSPLPSPLGDRIVAAVYFVEVSTFTIGFGDMTPYTTIGEVITIILDLFAYCFMSALVSGVVDDVIHRLELWLGFEDMVEARRTTIRVVCAIFVVICGFGGGFILVAYVFRLFGQLDSLYLVLATLTTIGYGDVSFLTLHGRLFAICWIAIFLPVFERACRFLVLLCLSCRFLVDCEIFFCNPVGVCLSCIWLTIRDTGGVCFSFIWVTIRDAVLDHIRVPPVRASPLLV